MTRLIYISLALGLLATCASPQSPAWSDGTVRGVVFTVDASGGQVFVPAANVSLDGPIHVEAESNGEGKFAFTAVPTGSYTIIAQAPGMTTQQGVTVTAGTVSELALEMKIQTVAESTTVTASSDSYDSRQSSGINTISESTVRNVPNLDERFNSLLPLIPGVVRGPNGQINMKGSRASQNGYLIEGRIWVNVKDSSIVRIEGQPARNPSFWVHDVHFVHTYQRVGQFWFASSTRSTSEVRIFGPSKLTIENYDYELNPPKDRAAEGDSIARLVR